MMRRYRPLKKSIGIVGEGLTERMYFDYIRSSRRYAFSLKPDLPSHTDYAHIFSKAKSMIAKGYDLVFCVLDIDVILHEHLLQDFQKACKELPKSILPITSNPCIEFWFLLHFLDSPKSRVYESCESVINKALRKYIPGYEKTETYLSSFQAFIRMEQNNGLQQALSNADSLLSILNTKSDVSCCSFTEISLLITFLETCKKCDFSRNCKSCSDGLPTVFGC
ncbi:MAG: RloB domain-containing protein [Spirochaetia bacterium]|jgi:hypothetical protein|nr:RloB domain-containing protein [Spirochaetia bacterium]